MKVFIVGHYKDYSWWMKDLEITTDLDEADTVLFGGGEDVHPSLYGEKTGNKTYTNLSRDIAEGKIFNDSKGKLKIGICRGSQFLTVMSKGRLIQHVSNHTIGSEGHKITTVTGEEFNMPSTHHQMLYPYEVNHKLIAWASKNLSSTYLNGDNEEIELSKAFVEPEIVYYPDTNSLAIQGHPEMSNSHDLHDYLNKLIEEVSKKKNRLSLVL